MANPINKVGLIKRMTGLAGAMSPFTPSSPSKGASLAAGPDNVPAVIHGQDGTPKGPAMIKEGEIVFSVPAVVGAGNGDYDKGAKFLLELHKRLAAHGEHLIKTHG